MAKYSVDDLKGLYKLAKAQGVDALEQGERIALGRFCRKTGLHMPGVLPREVSQAEPVVVVPVSVPVEPAGQAQAGVVSTVSEDSALDLVRSMKWYGGEFPEGVVRVSSVSEPKWRREAGALREFRGRVARVACGLDRRQESRMRHGIRIGVLRAFTPKGSYEAEIMPEDESWSVLARYVGER